jgi:ribose transport system substrate-binding protein
MKKIWEMLMVIMLLVSLVGCSSDSNEEETKETTTTKEDTKETITPASAETATTGEPYEITVIIKATDSDYWQTLLLGAKAAAEESNGSIVVTTDGPPSEIDIDQQVSILENAIAAEPDGIVIASTSSDATVPAIEEAIGKGMPVVTIDNKLNTDIYTSFLATDHAIAAGMAAEAMVADWKKDGIDPSGKKVVVISSVAGTAVNTARTEGFIAKIKELVPDIVVLETQYGDNDISKALSIAENLMAANPDLIGIFGDNNHMGVGVSKAIEESGKAKDIYAYAFDADADEIAAIQNGYLRGIMVQDPYGMGYKGVLTAVAALKGEKVEKDVIVDATVVTLDNMEEEAVHKLLYPGE